jgi:hypothetical protein
VGAVMSLDIIRTALAWCTVINYGILIFWFVIFAVAHDWIYRIHCRWFTMPVEKFNTIHYEAIAFYKLGILIFNLVPYLALRIVG